MHGRLKVRTSAQEQELKRKERAEKVKAYKAGISKVFEKRQSGELDDEILQVSATLLIGNPDITTLWNIRKEVAQLFQAKLNETDFGNFIDKEVFLTEQCLRTNPKSYGAWHHRGWVLDLHPNANWERELTLCSKFLSLDERNFHCWDYRRLVAERSKVSAKDEFLFSTKKIEDNFSNYSAWHYRSKLLPITHPDQSGICLISPEKHRQEMTLVQNAAFTDPNDQSAWFYQRWLLGRDCSIQQRPRSAPCLVWLENSSAIVVCSEPTQPETPPQIMCGDQELQGKWHQASSHVWILEADVSWPCLSDSELQAVAACSSLVLKPVYGHENCFWGKQAYFSDNYSSTVAAELKDQLVSCQQLLELEPDSKWTLLTSVLLMQAIDRKLYHGDSMQALDKLPQVDQLRTGYYQDLRSKYLLEFQILLLTESSESPLTQVSLCNRGLSALYYMHLFALVRDLDLSNNDLNERCLPALASLLQCVKLVLDSNNFTCLEGLPNLPAIGTLSLCHNKLTNQPGVISKQIQDAKLQTLYELHLDGNPCQSLTDIQELVIKMSKNK